MHEASTFVSLLAQLAVMVACGLAGGAVMRLLRQPAVLGEMLGGVVLGPTVFGAWAPEQQAGLFPLAGDAVTPRSNSACCSSCSRSGWKSMPAGF